MQLREDVGKGVYVENLTEIEVTNVHDVVQLLLLVLYKTSLFMFNLISSNLSQLFAFNLKLSWFL